MTVSNKNVAMLPQMERDEFECSYGADEKFK